MADQAIFLPERALKKPTQTLSETKTPIVMIESKEGINISSFFFLNKAATPPDIKPEVTKNIFEVWVKNSPKSIGAGGWEKKYIKPKIKNNKRRKFDK